MDDETKQLLRDIRDELRLIRMHFEPVTDRLDNIFGLSIAQRKLQVAGAYLDAVRSVTPEAVEQAKLEQDKRMAAFRALEALDSPQHVLNAS